jgi:single-strand DNA-binding protein
MANFNKVMLLGNLTRDPELRYLPSQTPVVEFGLAINRKYYGQDKQLKEEVCFVDCQVFGKQAETIHKYCKKGNPLFVEGRLKFDSWTKQDGSKASKLRVNVENFQLLGGAPGQGGQRTAVAGASNDDGPPIEEPMPSDLTHPNDDIPF